MEKEKLIKMYRIMVTIRHFEEKTIELYKQGYIKGYLHSYIGEEAVAVGACFAIDGNDYITSTHRGHGHCIAKGARLDKMMAELLAKETGYCKGRGGSMHICDINQGILGANGIVGGGLPIAVGAALGSKLKGSNQVTLCFFGEGATNNGVFHESLNLAALWKLAVVFICENNLYAVSTPFREASSVADVAERSLAYEIPGEIVDGNDVLAVYKISEKAVERARRGEGPTLIEAKTYRWTGHHLNDPATYRRKEEVMEWKQRDPIKNFRSYLLKESILTEHKVNTIDKEVDCLIKEAVKFALDSPEPSLKEFLDKVDAGCIV